MHREWRGSPHAHSAESELYLALRRTSDASCDRCHEPLGGLGASVDLARAEGVGCEVCHRMDRVEVRSGYAEAPLRATGGTKFGPRCDPHPPYFHRAECSPIFARSEFCAACHLLFVSGEDGRRLPIHSEYDDWLRGPYAARGQTCQSCHMMPGVEAELAVGEAKRSGVVDHGFWGLGERLRGTGLSARAEAVRKGDAITLKVHVENTRAGHFIPAGGGGRELVLRVLALSESGEEIARDERIFARRLVDAEGRPATHPGAVRVERDTRIAAREARSVRFELNAPGARAVRVVLLRRSNPELLQRLGVSPGREEPISALALQLGTGAGAQRVRARPLSLLR